MSKFSDAICFQETNRRDPRTGGNEVVAYATVFTTYSLDPRSRGSARAIDDLREAEYRTKAELIHEIFGEFSEPLREILHRVASLPTTNAQAHDEVLEKIEMLYRRMFDVTTSNRTRGHL